MSIFLLMILAVLAVVFYVIFAYNKAVSLRNYVREAFSTMDVYLKKRWDLIPNLVETVKKYTSHEKEVLTAITELRSKNYSNLSNSQKIDANLQLKDSISSLNVAVENYPDLKADSTYLALMNQLNELEGDIANARKYYNGSVRELNTFLEVFPTNIIGNMFNFQKEKMFEIEVGQRENVKVDF